MNLTVSMPTQVIHLKCSSPVKHHGGKKRKLVKRNSHETLRNLPVKAYCSQFGQERYFQLNCKPNFNWYPTGILLHEEFFLLREKR